MRNILYIWLFVLTVRPALAAELSIYQIQNTAHPQGKSPYAGQVVDCEGGIVTHKFPGFRPKFTLQMPDNASPQGNAFRAVQVKDWLTGSPLFNMINKGDFVSLKNLYVEEYRGNTILQAWSQNNPQVTVLSTANPLPQPLTVDVNEIPSPLQGADGGWYVQNHCAEKYEHMLLKVHKVTVTDMNLGKAADNYALTAQNTTCWAADYMNNDANSYYHQLVSLDAHFCSLQGILEQYTNDLTGWDYYQLVTTSTADFNTGFPADIDTDCDVDLQDYSILALFWQNDCADDPNICGGADILKDSNVNLLDFIEFSSYWLEGNIID